MVRQRRQILTSVHLLLVAGLLIWLGSLSVSFPAKFSLLWLATLLIPARA